MEDGQGENHTFKTECLVQNLSKDGEIFEIETNQEPIFAKNVVVASGGLSYPQMGATNIAAKIAKNFGIKTVSMVPALAGIRYPENCQFDFTSLSGNAITAKAEIGKRQFTDQLLFTHRGFSGPLALNLSLFVNGKTEIAFNFLPDVDVEALIQKEKSSKKSLVNILGEYLPKSLVKVLLKEKDYNLAQMKKSEMEEVARAFNHFVLEVEKLDGFDKAEVTRGGVSVDEIFPKTMEARKCPGLYFIGEALDVTGMLGGYNLHWAWASAKMFIDSVK